MVSLKKENFWFVITNQKINHCLSAAGLGHNHNVIARKDNNFRVDSALDYYGAV